LSQLADKTIEKVLMYKKEGKMKKLNRFITAILLAVLLALPCSAIEQEKTSPEQARTASLDQKLPIGPHVTVGQFDNGLRYYIRENKRPENRAELRLAVNVGSVLEDDDQQGLAHFLEHMAFNGTKNFKKHKLIEFMESVGMRLGPGVNAYTSFEETVYMITIPTDAPEVMETAFQILEDWTHALLLEKEEIDKERGVIVEEWRLGRGAFARMRDKQFPILFKDSRYAERLVIGKKDIIENFKYKVLKRFYKDWYRPDLMAILAVGDFDKSKVQALIEKHFSTLPRRKKPRSRQTFEVPDHKETLFAIATDKEATSTNVAVYHKMPLRKQETVGAYRERVVEGIYNGMLNQRFRELTQKPDPPFIGAFSSRGPFLRSKEAYTLSAGVKEDGIERGLDAVLTESDRVSRFGFTDSELERQKREILRWIERAYTEREKTDSYRYVSEYIRHFLTGESIPGIEYEFELYKRFVPEVTLEEINSLGKEWLTEENRVIVVSAPEKEGLHVPTEEELLAVFDAVEEKEITPYVDTTPTEPLMAELPEPGEVLETKTIDELEITEWELSNGVRVVLKPTDFKADEIVFRAFSPGGTSLATDEDFIPARTAAQAIASGGLGKFNIINLQKMLSGKVASVRPFIGELEEGLSGNASPKDLETMFQLVYLTFTTPRADADIFKALTSRMTAVYKNRSASPMAVFFDTLQKIMSQDHLRARPYTVETIEGMDLERSYAFYKDRFADASDFTFIIVGNFDLESIEPLVTRYLGTLPSIGREESWRDVGIDPPKGVIEKTINKGLEPQSRASIIFTGPFQYDQDHRNAIRGVSMVLQTRLRETLREELGGTYSVSAGASYDKIPDQEYSISINFGTDPERVEELTKVVFKEIEKLKTEGVRPKEINDFKKAEYRTFETGIKRNSWLLAQLAYKYQQGDDPRTLFDWEKSLERITPETLQKAAQTYLNMENYVQLILLPEKKEK
jgi:zinc protease